MQRDFSNREFELAIVIVNYRTATLVLDCLSSLLPDLDKIDARAVVVDNNSGDGSADAIHCWIENNHQKEKIRLVRSSENGGFSSGNNLGISAVNARYYLLLNSDTLVRTGAIAHLLKTICNNPKIGLLGPQLEHRDGVAQISKFRRHSCISEFLRGAQLSFFDGLLRRYRVPIDGDRCAAIDWISFACVMIRRDVLQNIGALDEGFFMYFEDAEFCERAKAAGWHIQQENASRIVHLRGGSSEVKRNTASQRRLPSYFYQSRARYFRLRGGLIMLVGANLSWMLGRTLGLMKHIFGHGPRGPAKEMQDIWQGFGPNCFPRSSSR